MTPAGRLTRGAGSTALGQLALARLRRRPGRWVAVSVVVAVAIGLLGTLRGVALLGGEEAAQRSLVALGPVSATWSAGLPEPVAARAGDSVARAAGVPPGAVTRSLLLQPTRVDGGDPVRLAAVTSLARWVRLRSGRLPTTCGPARCEVLQLDAGRAVRPRITGRGVRLVVVGRARLRSARPLGFVPGAAGRARDAVPLLASDGPAALEAAGGLDGVARTHAWSAAPVLRGVPAWRLDDVARRISVTAAAASARDRGLTFAAPTDALRAAAARARTAPGRVAVAGGVAAAGLAALVLLAALGLRQGLAAELARLERRGAGLGQRAALAVAECGLPVLLGAALGALAAVVGVAGVATTTAPATLGVGEVVGRALASPRGLAAGAGAVVVAVVLTALGACLSGRWARRVADALLVACGAALVALTARGALAVDAAGPLWALPVLASVALGLALARATPLALRGLSRAVGSRRAPDARLALLELARRPGPPAATLAAVAVAVGLIVFAAAYRTSLREQQAAQAAFRVPLDATVAPGRDLGSPLAGTSLRDWRAVPGVAEAHAVLRSDADAVQGPDVQPVTMLAVPLAVLDALTPQLALRAGRLPAAGPAPPGARLPPEAGALRVRAASTGGSLQVAALLRDADGITHPLALGTTDGPARVLRAAIPGVWRGAALAGFAVTRSKGELATAGHQAAEDTVAPTTLPVRLVLAPPTDDRGRRLADYRGYGGTQAAQARVHGGRLTARLRFDRDGTGLLQPTGPGDRAPLAVVADAQTAADAGASGRVELGVAGATLPGVVVGVATRVPTVTSPRFVVADLAAAQRAIDRSGPGPARPRELWLAAAPGTPADRLAAALRAGRPPGSVTVTTRPGTLGALRAEPLSRALLAALRIAAIVLGALAALGLALVVRRTVRDGAATWADHEAGGATPGTLRRVVALQGCSVVLLGVLGGAVVGAILARLVGGLVAVTRADAAAGPVAVASGWGTVVVAVGLLAGVAVLLVIALAARSFRSTWPPRPLGGEAP